MKIWAILVHYHLYMYNVKLQVYHVRLAIDDGHCTSVSGGQLNDDDHCFHLSELNWKKYACPLKRTARAVAGNSIKENKALQMFLQVLPMASQKKCYICCCKSLSRWYSIVENIVEDVKNCFNVETWCDDACLCASCRRNLTRWQRSCDEEKEKYFVKAQSRGKAFLNKTTLAQQDQRLAVTNITEKKKQPQIRFWRSCCWIFLDMLASQIFVT